MKKLITEADIVKLNKSGTKIIAVDGTEIFTPSALDLIRETKIVLSHKSQKQSSPVELNNDSNYKPKKIAIGCDHTGLNAKKILIEYLKSISLEVIDVGTYSTDSCDYPDYALQVAKNVVSGNVDFGIMLDATGIPSAITVNKLPGIRGATCYNEFTAKSAREHNNANILVMGAKTLGDETLKSILKTWLETSFAGGRHQKRLDKIKKIEERLLKAE